MKTISAQLLSLFQSDASYGYCGLYQFNLVQGGSLYYASGDTDILLETFTSYTDESGNPYMDESGNPYVTETPASQQLYTSGGSVGPYFDRKDNKAKMSQSLGLTVDTLVFDVIPGAAIINGASFLTCIREGIFDGAELIYSGAFWPLNGGYQSPIVPTGAIVKYVGRVAEVDCSRNLATFTINSYLELLNQNMPRNLFSAGCVNTLYDSSCTLNQANFTTSGTALSASQPWSISTNIVAPTGYSCNLGTLIFTSGANQGVSRTIKQFNAGTPGTITLIAPFPSIPANGDTFNISAGCNKTASYCATSMNNLVNFRGMPFIPQQEAAS